MTARARSIDSPAAADPRLPAPADIGPLGGHVAELHDMIALRMGGESTDFARSPLTWDEAIVQTISRAAGPLLLVAVVAGLVWRMV